MKQEPRIKKKIMTRESEKTATQKRRGLMNWSLHPIEAVLTASQHTNESGDIHPLAGLHTTA